MATSIQLTYKGETAYPRTITSAIVDEESSLRLSALLRDLGKMARGWHIDADASIENAYNLLDAKDVCRGSIVIPKAPVLESGFYDPDTRSIVLTFDRQSGLSPLRIPVGAFVTSQTIGEGLEMGEDGKLRIKVAPNGHLKLVDGALALDAEGIAFYEDTKLTF